MNAHLSSLAEPKIQRGEKFGYLADIWRTYHLDALHGWHLCPPYVGRMECCTLKKKYLLPREAAHAYPRWSYWGGRGRSRTWGRNRGTATGTRLSTTRRSWSSRSRDIAMRTGSSTTRRSWSSRSKDIAMERGRLQQEGCEGVEAGT